MSLVAFAPEEQVEAFGEKLTLRLDFAAITTIEGALNMPMPLVSAHIRGGNPPYSLLAQVLWALLRKHNSHVTHDEALAIVMNDGEDGAKVGFALDALLERAFPLLKEDKEQKKARKPSGRSKSSVVSG